MAQVGETEVGTERSVDHERLAEILDDEEVRQTRSINFTDRRLVHSRYARSSCHDPYDFPENVFEGFVLPFSRQ